MSGNRKAAEKLILDYIQRIANDQGQNRKIYADKFAKMDDEAFEAFIQRLETEQEWLTVQAPNFGPAKLDVGNNIKIARELGHEFFQRLWIGAQGDRPAYLTPIPYLVMDLPVRRASQILKKKISVAEHNKTVDALSGQATGDSKGSRLSFPEMQIMAAMGCDKSITEMMKYRGGDVRGFNAMNAMLTKYGAANQQTLANFASGVESIKTLSTYLTCAHLKNSLLSVKGGA